MRIVIVEDEPVQRSILAEACRGQGHDVRTFSAGESAVEAVRSWPPDILVCELELIGLPGEEVARAADALARPAWIILTSVDPRRLARARDLGDTLLCKPFHLRELARLVEMAGLRVGSQGFGSSGART